MASLRAQFRFAAVVKNRESGLTLATSVYEAIRLDIIEGRYEPGEKLRFDALRGDYDVGISPIREALSRLHSDGWVTREEQRGFRVANVSRHELQELIRTRILIEGIAIREAIAHPDLTHEEELVLAFHRLSKQPRYLSKSEPIRNPEWERHHREFHRALVAGCKLKWVIQYCAQLFDVADRYRMLAAASTSERKEKEEHEAILQAFVAGDPDEVIRLLGLHYQITVDIIMKARFGSYAVD